MLLGLQDDKFIQDIRTVLGLSEDVRIIYSFDTLNRKGIKLTLELSFDEKNSANASSDVYSRIKEQMQTLRSFPRSGLLEYSYYSDRSSIQKITHKIVLSDYNSFAEILHIHALACVDANFVKILEETIAE